MHSCIHVSMMTTTLHSQLFGGSDQSNATEESFVNINMCRFIYQLAILTKSVYIQRLKIFQLSNYHTTMIKCYGKQ